MCYSTGKYTACRSVHACFSPELLQALAAKGLIKYISFVNHVRSFSLSVLFCTLHRVIDSVSESLKKILYLRVKVALHVFLGISMPSE